MNEAETRGEGLALVGLRGTGKSSVGRLLAARLGLPFVDTDTAIEQAAGRSIRAIFTEWGEPRFRDLEQAALEDHARGPAAVLATGGGIILRAGNRATLRRHGRVVWLTAGVDVLASRLATDARTQDDRPALTAAGTIAELADVLAARTPLYADVADVAVDTGGKSVAEVAEAVLRALEAARAPATPAGLARKVVASRAEQVGGPGGPLP